MYETSQLEYFLDCRREIVRKSASILIIIIFIFASFGHTHLREVDADRIANNASITLPVSGVADQLRIPDTKFCLQVVPRRKKSDARSVQKQHLNSIYLKTKTALT